MAKKKRQDGRFVTLQSGRVIFIPAGKRTKWADVRDKIKAKRGEVEGPRGDVARWKAAGMAPGDFGVKTWAEVDPEVADDVMERAGKGARREEGPLRGGYFGSGEDVAFEGMEEYQEEMERGGRADDVARWKAAGMTPGDFGVKTWAEVDPEVADDAMERAGK